MPPPRPSLEISIPRHSPLSDRPPIKPTRKLSPRSGNHLQLSTRSQWPSLSPPLATRPPPPLPRPPRPAAPRTTTETTRTAVAAAAHRPRPLRATRTPRSVSTPAGCATKRSTGTSRPLLPRARRPSLAAIRLTLAPTPLSPRPSTLKKVSNLVKSCYATCSLALQHLLVHTGEKGPYAPPRPRPLGPRPS